MDMNLLDIVMIVYSISAENKLREAFRVRWNVFLLLCGNPIAKIEYSSSHRQYRSFSLVNHIIYVSHSLQVPVQWAMLCLVQMGNFDRHPNRLVLINTVECLPCLVSVIFWCTQITIELPKQCINSAKMFESRWKPQVYIAHTNYR